MKHIIKYLFKNKIAAFVSLSALLFLSCTNDLSKTDTDTAVTGIHITSAGNAFSIVKGDTYRLQAKVLPEYASDKRLSFSSSAEGIASVNVEGVITAYEEGNAVITIRAANGVQKTINVTVTPAPIAVAEIKFEETPPESLIIGDSYTFKAKVTPDDATEDKTLIYGTTTPELIDISDTDGTVHAKKDGTASITVTVARSSVAKTVTIEIKKKPQIKYESKQAVMRESAAGTYTFEVQTIDGKLDYEPRFTSNEDKLPWITGAPTIASRIDSDKDIISFTCTENKTVWDRRAYIKFWDKTAKAYIKNADDKKDLTVNIIQKKNENPVVHYRWVKGINAPTAGQKEKMPIIYNSTPTGDYYEQPYVFKWNETADTNFYNARKLSKLRREGFPSNYFMVTETINNTPRQGTDLSQCWAKTASNMLHWWFEQNKDYIEQYKAKSNIAPNSLLYRHNYIRNLPDEREGEKSDIANIFRVYTHDRSYGGYIEDGLTWYLYKRDGQKTLGSIYPGLFNDVFTFDTRPINTERCETKKEFERIMNEAFDKGRAIGLFWKGSKGRLYQHAVTCWGAAYDADNNIICLYIAESNLTEPALYPYGVQYRGNIYDEPEQNSAYMFNYYLSKPEDIYVDSITTLDLGEEQWKAWLAAHP
ncbi:Ig-like domain-containing protein [Treponema socranskii subsp. buccale]|uniref:IdeS/Mac family cysteine endopeptidase n=1 Tax=Treponema socranskii TaxID=53419 RepID=UPI0020A30581|nr:IdeS/Mac family cysteine endopeptidase [Treponema socranskii]UTD02098.1 Ig-like domain-containing protein [Treponema socranskii subsp. buccale]